MSGTRSPSRTEPATEPPEDEGRWPVWKLAVMLYPLSAGAMAINVFLLGLMFQPFGFEALDPVVSLLIGLAIGVPATWFFGARFRALMDEADGRR